MFATDNSLKYLIKIKKLFRGATRKYKTKYLIGAIIMPWFYIPQKQKVCYLLVGKNISFSHFTLVLKIVTVNKFMNLLLMMNLAGDHSSLCGHFQPQAVFPCSYFPPFNLCICWDGCSDILFNKLNSLHKRAAKLMISDSFLSTHKTLRYLGLLPLKESLCSIRLC